MMMDLLSFNTVLGFVWSVAIFYLLYAEKGVQISSSKWFLLFTVPAAYLVIPAVSAQVNVLTLAAGGVQTLDVHIGYNSGHISEFAEALGEAGRQQYARFQLGLDTLAPPAIAGFVLNVGRITVPFAKVRKLLTVIVSVYFISVLCANALMPVIMLNFPGTEVVFSILYIVVPLLDGTKYATHALAWVLILLSALTSLSHWIRGRILRRNTEV